MEQTKTPRHAWIAFGLALLLPVYFAIAALGTKIGLWSWQTGLLSLTFGAGPFLLGIVAVVGLISLVLIVRKVPRKGWPLAALALIVPAAFALVGLSAAGTADENPIHDVATDTGNPPQFSAATMAEREQAGANPVHDYQTPLRDIEMFKGTPPELSIQSHAQIITERYAGLAPLPLGGASPADAIAAVAAAMGEMGFENIRSDVETGMVEGVAETFWFGFKDDVVARVGENQIDFRSVSRVGRSDLGANAERIRVLRAKTAARIGQR
ncbi:DUF1499 domain-containing protein [Erythrobacter sp. JK5]|uniref:DUF1499 domain-containing protein n=1 Tax=Erythrobacter sp. JK5 TaxID=2829500 RepID=UPI001BA93C5A|nr:DUF1499 domain-containing protein [Erythrobacter sp. JK5]QUL38017.1 DUF1499 domain-containing protein [Erythrobacter sp. JK5]